MQPKDTVIDATCGNGKDTEVLAALVPEGHVWSMDIQKNALERARQRISAKNVTFLCQSHADFPLVSSPKLIVYNLGYLPGGDKTITTMAETTLASVQKALDLVCPGGAVSIMCYPGHPEGAREQKILLHALKPSICHFWDETSPSLIWLIK